MFESKYEQLQYLNLGRSEEKINLDSTKSMKNKLLCNNKQTNVHSRQPNTYTNFVSTDFESHNKRNDTIKNNSPHSCYLIDDHPSNEPSRL